MKFKRLLPRNFYIFLAISALISSLSAWRCIAIFRLSDLVGWGLLALFLAFWLAAYGLWQRFNPRRLSRQAYFAALLGAGLCGLAGLLLTTPAGISRVTLELYADNVWSPNSFTAGWVDEGLWDAPLTLPIGKAAPVTLEIRADGEKNEQAEGSQVWLVSATWPDGQTIPLDQFQADAGWQQRELTWGTTPRRPVWVSASPDQPAVLRWSGVATGPLTLVFAQHSRAGRVTIRWHDLPPTTLDLYAPDIAVKSVTLPLTEPAVWRVNLPWSAWGKDINIVAAPDPTGKIAAVIKKVNLIGLPARPLTATGDNLNEALQMEEGRLSPTPDGAQLMTNSRKEAQLFLAGPLAVSSNWVEIIPKLENGLVVLYAAVLGGLVVAGLAGLDKTGKLVGVNVLVISTLAALVMVEVGLRLYLPSPSKYYVWPPGLHAVFKPSAAAMPGITGEANFIINSQGIRGDELSGAENYRFLAVGGSTTECLFLNQPQAWPQLTQTLLNQKDRDLKIWVGSIGKAGRNTREHILQMKYLLPQYTTLDAVLVLIGVNDFILRLELGDAYTADYITQAGAKHALMQRSFDVFPRQDPNLLPYYQQTAIAHLVEQARQAHQPVEAAAVEIQDENGSNVIKRRQQRQTAAIRNQLPDLAASLDEYSRNINTLIDLAQARQVRLILLTQPTMWRADLPQAEQDLLWLGWGPEEKFYYSVEALAEGMAAYNQRLLQICAQRQVECLDLATTLPKDTTVFYDDVHFNESGSRQVAQLVADYLLRHPPFGSDK